MPYTVHEGRIYRRATAVSYKLCTLMYMAPTKYATCTMYFQNHRNTFVYSQCSLCVTFDIHMYAKSTGVSSNNASVVAGAVNNMQLVAKAARFLPVECMTLELPVENISFLLNLCH